MEKLETGQLRPDSAVEARIIGVAAAIGDTDIDNEDFFHIKHSNESAITRDEVEFARRDAVHGPLLTTKHLAEAAETGLHMLAEGQVYHELVTPEIAVVCLKTLGRIGITAEATIPQVPPERLLDPVTPVRLQMPPQLLSSRMDSIFLDRRESQELTTV